MSEPIFKSNRNEILRKNRAMLDMAWSHMAMDIERYIKQDAGTPVDTGEMKAEVRHFRSPISNGWRVEAGKVYSAYQERGSEVDGSRRVRHYTTGGTSAGWFQRSIDAITRQRSAYISEAMQAVGL